MKKVQLDKPNNFSVDGTVRRNALHRASNEKVGLTTEEQVSRSWGHDFAIVG